MSNDTVKLIVGIIQGTLREGRSMPLHELLWSVDAQLHLIVSAEEINEAHKRMQRGDVRYRFVIDASSLEGQQDLEIRRSGSQASTKGSVEYFTGNVRIDPLFQGNAPGRAAGASVTFEPGARTAWHTHPLGQALIVISGSGLVQSWGRPVEQIRPGDVVWVQSGEKHWHGATPTTALTHIAIQEQMDGKTADWMERVSDKQYHA